jgi:hypothetical protein
MATLLLLSALAVASAPPFCSIVALPVFRDPTATYLVGTATPDTARAAPGGPPVGLPGLAPEPPRASHGQLVRVDQFRGPDSALVERAFARRGVREALVVPWGYGPACEPIPWTASARWAPVGTPATYRLHLRPEAEWAGGVPVFDAVRAELQPYPHGLLAPPPSDGAALTASEFMALYAALPTDREAAEQPAVARGALDAWEREHPHLAGRFPAAAVLRSARATLAMQHPR